jgi:hypothetical protein
LSIADLRASGMGLHWFEVVALIQTLCQTIVEASGSGDLDLTKAFLTAEGTIDLAKPPDPGKAFPQVRKLLNDMVPSNEFAVAKVLPDSSIADYLNALAYYERPNRDEIVQSIYTRFSSRVVANTLVLPTRKIEPPPDEPAAAEEDVREKAARRGRLLQMIAVVAFLGCVAVAGVWALNNPAVQSRFNAYAATLTSLAVGGTVPGYSKSEPAPSSPAPEAEHDDPPPTTRARAVKPADAPAATRPVTRTEGRAPSAVPATVPTPSGSPASAQPAASPIPATPPPIATGPQRAPVFAPPQPPAAQPAASAVAAVNPVDPVEDAQVFEASQRDVTPPQFVSPSAPPSVPEGLDPKTAPALEVLVNERGIVEGAKLCSPPRSLAESMEMMSEISAAKMWRFRPAIRDGRPVKYRLIVRLGPR